MIEIPLNHGYVTVIDDEDADLAAFTWTVSQGKPYGQPYVSRQMSIGGKLNTIWLHRFILERMTGRELLRHELTDHRDTNPLNNRRSNLRVASPLQNSANRRRNKNNTTGFKGVSFSGYKDLNKQFIASCGGKFLGAFPTAEFAYAAYCNAAHERWGEFANVAPAPASEWDGGAASKPAAVPIAARRPASSETGRVTRLQNHVTSVSTAVPKGTVNGR